MSQLTVERLFSEPAINGELPSHMKFAPDGKRIAWLQVAEDDRERLDLWMYDVDAAVTKQVLDASVAGQRGVLSDAEKAKWMEAVSGAIDAAMQSKAGNENVADIVKMMQGN